MTPQQEERLAEALRHVEMGFAVMSVWSTDPDGTCRCGKVHADKKSMGKHPIPPKGFLDASTDPKRVETMLSAASEPNYGIVWPEGAEDVVFEWDVDGADWKARIEGLKAEYGPLPATKTTRSPSGGLHVFYKWPKGLPVPEGNHLHGFVVRWPWKGYVVGPKSRINGKVYEDVGSREIAELPLAWAVTGPVPSTEEPLIRVSGEQASYRLPDRVETGGRHDEIARFVGSLWNQNLTEAAALGLVEVQLRPLFAEAMDDARLREEVHHAFETAQKRWKEPAGVAGAPVPVQIGDIVIDPLAIATRIDSPKPLVLDDVLPVGLALLLDHYRQLTDAPWSSLALASSVVMSALVGTAPTLGWRGGHRSALFGVLVGHSGYGRKGATMRVVERAFNQVDPLLAEVQVSGIASGEVLVDILNESKTNTIGTTLVWEHEIGNVLVLAAREGNIMSGNLRRAWDGDAVQSRSRAKGKSSATGYNIAFMGGVTPSELEKRLTANDIANGWANRFLWFHSEKRNEPWNSVPNDDLDPGVVAYLRDCISFGRSLGGSMLIRPRYTMELSPEALERMEAVATALDVLPVGVIGALRQRMPAHTIRLAMVAALFDQTRVVGIEHVAFGERMTAYAVDSMRPAFGMRIDDDVSMLIVQVLMQVPDGWMNTTDLRKSVGNKDHARLMKAMSILLREGVVVREERKTGGRPAVGYRLSVAL